MGELPKKLQTLRERAEDIARGQAGLRPEPDMGYDDMELTLHELQVHQIELEMQNDQLRTAQLALDAERARYFELYDLAPVGYCSVSQAGMILQANLRAATLLGMARGALVRQPLSRFIARASQDAYYLCRRRIQDSDHVQACELQLIGQESDPQWVNLVMAPAHEGTEPGVLRITLTDISEAKILAMAMRDSEERYRAMVEWSPNAILVHRNLKILYVNAAAVTLFGARHAHELISRNGMDLIDPDFHDSVRAKLKVGYRLNEVSPMVEEVLLKMDGSPMNVEVQMLAIMFKGEPALQVTMRDVTERRRMLEATQANSLALEAARAEAEKANNAKSDFLSSMSHELRTPLHAILGFAQLIEASTPPLTASQHGNLGQILKAGWYLLSLINEVLDLAKIESGHMALATECVPVSELLEEVRSLMVPLATQREILMAFPALAASRYVMADRHRVKQVLINLLTNAIKYNRVAGRVEVTVEERAEDRVRIAISDTGEGMSEAQILGLFQPFNRLGREHSSEDGTGIGLVVCRRLVGMMGGQMGVTSTVGEGSTFWFELNFAPPPPGSLNSRLHPGP